MECMELGIHRRQSKDYISSGQPFGYFPPLLTARIVGMHLIRALPLEIHDLIIESLSRETDTLLQASLTCKVWRSICYRHLFSYIILNLRSIPSFFALLENQFTRTTIPLCIRRLSINLQASSVTSRLCWRERLIKIFLHLSDVDRVEHLILSNMCTTDDILCSMLSSSFTNIRSLDLSNTYFDDPMSLGTFLSAYAHVKQVVLRDILCPIPPSSFVPPVPPVGAYGLQISASVDLGFHASLKWCRTSDAKNLQQLGVVSLIRPGNIHQILHILAPFLNFLELMHPAQNVEPQSSFPYDINLHNATHLRFLSLGFPDRVLGVMPWILRTLHYLQGCSLRGLRLSFSASQQFTLDIPFLKLLHQTLEKPQFRKLQILQFFSFNTFGDKEIAKLVVKHVSESLRSWHEEGKLRFAFPP